MSYGASGAWNNPPPPGTLDEQYNRSSKDKGKSMKENYKRYSRSRSRSSDEFRRSRTRSFTTSSRSHSRSRDRDYHSKRHDRDHYRRRRSSHSRKRKSHHKSSRHRKHSKSRSRSHSRSRYHTRSKSRSRCRYSRSHSQSRSSSSDRDSSSYQNKSKNYVPEVPKNRDYIRKVYSKSKQNEVPAQENTFKNDGSFLEMFKKMQEQQQVEKKEEALEPGASEVKKTIPIFGKRRGGKVLKTGVVEKVKSINEVEEEPKDAWSVYMKEVKRYKEACCDDDSKTRPLVK